MLTTTTKMKMRITIPKITKMKTMFSIVQMQTLMIKAHGLIDQNLLYEQLATPREEKDTNPIDMGHEKDNEMRWNRRQGCFLSSGKIARLSLKYKQGTRVFDTFDRNERIFLQRMFGLQ